MEDKEKEQIDQNEDIHDSMPEEQEELSQENGQEAPLAEEEAIITEAEPVEETIPSAEADEKSVSALQSELAEQKDKFVRLYAEFENFRRRTNKEKADVIKNANQNFMRDLLSVLDDFERALKSMHEGRELELADSEALHREIEAVEEGVKLVFSKFYKTLEQKGLKPMEPSQGQPFDVEKHESITQIPAPSEDMKGKIVDEIEKGYYLNDRVLRFAKVVIGG